MKFNTNNHKNLFFNSLKNVDKYTKEVIKLNLFDQLFLIITIGPLNFKQNLSDTTHYFSAYQAKNYFKTFRQHFKNPLI